MNFTILTKFRLLILSNERNDYYNLISTNKLQLKVSTSKLQLQEKTLLLLLGSDLITTTYEKDYNLP